MDAGAEGIDDEFRNANQDAAYALITQTQYLSWL